MSLNSEITRLQNAKATLKTKLNARNDNQHQIDDETIDEYGAFVDSIPQGGGGIDWSQIGYSAEPQFVTDGFNYAKQIYDNWDSSQTDYSSKFNTDTNLKYMPLVDVSNGTSFYHMFYSCSILENVPQLDTSNGTNFQGMFNNCSKLTTIPQLDTSKGITFNNMFSSCSALTTIPQLVFSKSVSVYNMFSGCSALTTVGGFLNLGQAYLTTQSANFSNYTLKLNSCTLLTHDSLMNVINNLYDIATKGCNAQTLYLGSTNLAKLTAEEIAIATNRGWSVS